MFIDGLKLSLICCFTSTLLVACSHSGSFELNEDVKVLIEADSVREEFPALDNSLFGDPFTLPTREELLGLSPEQEQEFLNFVKQEVRNDSFRYQDVYRYLESIADDFEYISKTQDAKQSLLSRSGNCISLAILTAALANFHDVNIEYQLVNRLPVYQEYGDIIFNARHIRSVLYPPKNENISVTTPRLRAVVDYYPSRYSYVSARVDESGLLGQYFRNLSGEALVEKDYRKSYYYLLEALVYEPEHEEAINNLAILHRRIGAIAKAEEFYRYGIKTAKNRLSLLKNYRNFLFSQNRGAEAEVIAEELEKYHDPDPFPWMHSANEAFDQADYKTALKHYEKAIELADYLHQAHFGKAKSLFKLGRISETEYALKRALEEAFDVRSKEIYEAKLIALSKQGFY